MSSEKILQYPQALCNQVRRVVYAAGQATLPYFDQADTLDVTYKADGSPVTEADRIAEEMIEAGLKEIAASVPMIGEEAVSGGRVTDLSQSEYFWLVDPVDGTKGFASGDYTVNVALIHQGVPVVGVIYAPVRGELYTGSGAGQATRFLESTNVEKAIRVRDVPRDGFTVVTNRTLDRSGRLGQFLESFKIAKTTRLGSSLKLCLIAAGKADLYPRFGPISEWDIAAGDAILRSAGGSIIDLNGESLTYGHTEKNFLSPEFIASAGTIPVENLLEGLTSR